MLKKLIKEKVWLIIY